MNLSKFLSHVFLFSGMQPAEIDRIAGFATLQKLSKDQFLFGEGDPVEALFIVVYGQVKVFKLTRNGDEQTLHIHAEKDLVAEAAIFGMPCFPASAKALTETTVVRIDRQRFLDEVLGNKALTLKLLTAFAKRLREFVTLVESLSLSNIKQRLIQYLLGNAREEKGKTVCELTVSKKELSALLGTSPETLSRALTYLKKNDYLKDEGKVIQINNKERLKALL